MQTNTFDFKNQVAKEHEKTIHEINDILSLPKCNLYVLFGNQDWRRGDGLYIYVKVGGIETDIPDEVSKIIEKKKPGHLIWISNRVCVGDPIHLAWTYSHELQHLKQFLQNPTFYFLHEFFWKSLVYSLDKPDTPPQEPIRIPTEYDAERVAKRVVTQIFGKDERIKYIKSQVELNLQSQKWGRIISKADINKKYDVEAETVRYLCKRRHRRWFKERQTKLDNSSVVKTLNFDKICQEKKIPK